LRQIAATPLPKSFTNAKDVDAVKILRQAGLVIALIDPPPQSAATVFAITEEGNAELLRFHYPENERKPLRDHWLPPAAQRACEALKRSIRGE
jgi:hypothetical protein